MAPSQFLPAISSMSLGRAEHHAMEPKLAACARHGFQAIELYYEDLEHVARSLPPTHPAAQPGSTFPSSTIWDEQLLAAATYVDHLCDLHHLEVLCIQPFMHYEGLLDRTEHASRLRKLHLWFHLATRLHTDLIQIPSNFLRATECSDDRSVIIDDLRQAADLGAQYSPDHPIRFAYEALCWGTHINTWEAAYEIVQAVNRPNFGTVIDSFNLAGRVYGDPAQSTGRTAHAQEKLEHSMAELRLTLDAKKLFYVELVDAERLDRPLVEGHEWYRSDQDARMSWSRSARLFPGEEKGYLPIFDVLDAVRSIGYQGYISFEYFSRSMDAVGEMVPEEHAVRAGRSWQVVLKHLENGLVREGKGSSVRVGGSQMIPDAHTTQASPTVPRLTFQGPVMVDPI